VALGPAVRIGAQRGRVGQGARTGGQRRTAEYLLAHGADLNWVPEYADGTPLDAARELRSDAVAVDISYPVNLGVMSVAEKHAAQFQSSP
jgi:hypothetical protein